jgi:hypothetical protein
MNKEFIPYKQALDLKELGFNEPCLGYATIEYKDVVHCGIGFKIHKETDLPTKPFGVPLYQQAFRWFREKYNVHMYPTKYDETKWWVNWATWTSKVFDTYEEAELECLKKLIEIVKNKNKKL